MTAYRISATVDRSYIENSVPIGHNRFGIKVFSDLPNNVPKDRIRFGLKVFSDFQKKLL